MTAKLRKLLQAGEEQDCEQALRQVDPETVPYVLDESRAKYLEIVPLTPESRVLEIGASMGQHTRLIATRCRSLYALEVVEGQALFARLWCSQLGLSNVNVAVGGDDCRLPYLDRFFDTVILNLVLEWCANRASDDTAKVQMQLLSECNRVLAADGCLFLATKNRFSARLLTGGIDEHVNLRFGNALPRWMMNFSLRLKGQKEELGLLHSYRAMKKMILKSGFKRVESYWAVPDCRYPIKYVRHDPRSIAAARKEVELRHVNRLTRILLKYVPAYLIPRLAPSLVFLAYKG
ncbi:MAG: class I SAM-dependent methyltransferase [Gammaproteobacteria bacterium]|nr:class I SAM-dependent methyltransferase [Gammaproteobacteria bacterium]